VLEFELRAFTSSHSTSPFCEGFFKIGSHKLFAQQGLNLYAPDLCLLSSWDYRREPPVPGCEFILKYGIRKVPLHSSACGYPVFPRSFVEETVLSHMSFGDLVYLWSLFCSKGLAFVIFTSTTFLVIVAL
jgi:hypothetical protein